MCQKTQAGNFVIFTKWFMEEIIKQYYNNQLMNNHYIIINHGSRVYF